MSARLPTVSGQEAVRAFERAGWTVMRQRGSHVIMGRQGSRRPLVIPAHREVRRGTLRSLIKEAGLTVEEFVELTRR